MEPHCSITEPYIYSPPRLRTNILFRETIVVWKEAKKKSHLPRGISLYSPILHNPNFPNFPQGKTYKALSTWADNGLDSFKKLLTPHPWRPKPFSTLQVEYKVPNEHLLHLLQIAACWKFLRSSTDCFLTRSFFDKAITTKQYSISAVYSHLQILFLPSINSRLL